MSDYEEQEEEETDETNEHADQRRRRHSDSDEEEEALSGLSRMRAPAAKQEEPPKKKPVRNKVAGAEVAGAGSATQKNVLRHSGGAGRWTFGGAHRDGLLGGVGG